MAEQYLQGQREHFWRDIQRQKLPGLWQSWKEANLLVMSLKINKIFQIEKATQKPGIKVRKESRYFRIFWSSIEKYDAKTPCQKTKEM